MPSRCQKPLSDLPRRWSWLVMAWWGLTGAGPLILYAQTPGNLAQTRVSSDPQTPPATGQNVFPAGGFDVLDARGWPLDWSRPVATESVAVRQDAAGDRFVELLSAPTTGSQQSPPVQISARLALDSAWRFMQFSAKLRVTEPSNDPAHLPRVTIQWLDAGQKSVGQSVEIAASKPNQWVVASSPVVEIPPEATSATFTLTLASRGSFSVNDLRAIANPEFQPLPAGFPQGGFEKLDAAKQPVGWDVPPASRRVMLLEEAGNHYLRVVNDKQTAKSEHSVIYRLDPRWTQLTITARLRSPGSSPGSSPATAPGTPPLNSPETAKNSAKTGEIDPRSLPRNRLEISLLGKDRRPLPDSTRALWPASPSNDWQHVTLPVKIPPAGVYLRVNAIVTAPASALDIDDVQIERASPPPE